jgi:integrase
MLNHLALCHVLPQAKPYKLADEKGLYLLVKPSGARYWRLKYRFAGREKLLACGVFPETTLAEARAKRDDARKLLEKGTDPNAARQKAKLVAKLAGDTAFEAVAREWHAGMTKAWSEYHARDVLHRLEANAFRYLGKLPIAEITASQILAVLRTVEHRGAHELARRTRSVCGQIFRYAIATGLAERDPAADLKGVLKGAPKVRHLAALKEAELPDFLKKLDSYDGHPQTRLALRLLLLTCVRTGELRSAEWSEFDTDEAEWRIPAAKMKAGEEHVVPLSRQALAVLKELRQINGRSVRLFVNSHDHQKAMSENTILYALYRMGYHSRATGHGFRATAATILSEQGFRPELIERALAHVGRNKVKAAYQHSPLVPERRAMLQHWADFLDGLRAGAKVRSLKRRGCTVDAA